MEFGQRVGDGRGREVAEGGEAPEGVEGVTGDGQAAQVALAEVAGVVEAPGLVEHGAGEVKAHDFGSGEPEQGGVAAGAAAGVEDAGARRRGRVRPGGRSARLRPRRRSRRCGGRSPGPCARRSGGGCEPRRRDLAAAARVGAGRRSRPCRSVESASRAWSGGPTHLTSTATAATASRAGIRSRIAAAGGAGSRTISRNGRWPSRRAIVGAWAP